MNIAIDIVSTKIGGGLDYILNLLSVLDPQKHKFNKIFLFVNSEIKNLIPKKKFIKIIIIKNNDYLWFIKKNILIKDFIFKKKIDLLFVPSAINFIYNLKTVVMSQTLLPFRFDQVIKYFPHIFFYKLLLIKFFQIISFKNSNGVIFLNDFAKRHISKYTNTKDYKIIPLGIGNKKLIKLKEKVFNNKNKIPIKIIYISEVTNYKNQYEIIKELKNSNINFVIFFVGKIDKKYFNKLNKLNFPNKKFKFTGNLTSNETVDLLKQSDIFLHASSVENFPVSILEGLVSEKYIISTETEPVKSMLEDHAIFFSLKNQGELELKINEAIKSNMKKKKSDYLLNNFNYEYIAELTFKYFNYIANK